jgi:uncharacterized repeat protein (TIGR03803 family)
MIGFLPNCWEEHLMPRFAVRWFRRLSLVTLLGLCTGGATLATSPNAWAASEDVKYSFKPTSSNPSSGIVSVGNAFYGTTTGYNAPATIFKMTAAGKLHTIATFSNNFGTPSALVAIGKLLYGIINEGGDPTCNCGFLFSVTETGNITILHAFTGGSDGAGPLGSLIELNGVLYGTTTAGGTGACSESSYSGCGTVFGITPQGAYTQLYAFQGSTTGDGSFPNGSLTAVNGTLYGTTYTGGTSASQAFSGTLFSLSAQGVETVLHSFGIDKKDGYGPGPGLLSIGNSLYGTTSFGGKGGFGIAYSIGLDGTNDKMLHAFANDGADGVFPNGGLVAVGDLLYGTTTDGGSTGSGTVFSLTMKGSESIVYSFRGINKQLDIHDASSPNSPLLYLGGTFYGTSLAGGRASTQCYLHSCGTVFEVVP